MPRPYGLMYEAKGVGSINPYPLNPETCNWVDEFGGCIDPPTTLSTYQDLFGTALPDLTGSVTGGTGASISGSTIGAWVQKNQMMLLVGGIVGLLLFSKR